MDTNSLHATLAMDAYTRNVRNIEIPGAEFLFQSVGTGDFYAAALPNGRWYCDCL